MADSAAMDKWDGAHLLFGGCVLAAAGTALIARIGWLAAVLVALVNLYAMVTLWECARRADDPAHRWWQLPHIRWSLVQSGLLIASVVVSFATLYLQSGQVIDVPASSDAQGAVVYLSGRLDALFFAFMTLATQQFGDYRTVGWARLIASWELLTTMLLVFLILPLVLSKVGSYKVRD
jgi:hypothetical protein